MSLVLNAPTCSGCGLPIERCTCVTRNVVPDFDPKDILLIPEMDFGTNEHEQAEQTELERKNVGYGQIAPGATDWISQMIEAEERERELLEENMRRIGLTNNILPDPPPVCAENVHAVAVEADETLPIPEL